MNCEGLNSIEGIQIIPVDANKRPIPKGWQTAVKKYDLSQVAGVGLVCGAPSNNVMAVDFDLKYSLSPTLMEDYKKLVHRVDPDLLEKLVVQKTRSGGYHFIFRCPTLAGNQKLANRHTTQEEKKRTYDEEYKAAIISGIDEQEARKKAEKSSENDKVRVLIETRESGGQIVVSPSVGYEFVFGDLCSISEITSEQREILLSTARQFNEVFEEVQVPKGTVPKMKTKGKSSFEDYDERCDIVQLLTDHGWKFVKNKGSKIHFQRPGQTSAETSGNFDTSSGWFSVFTTSTEFEPNHGYKPYAVFATLECNKDFSAASRRLYEMGFGDRDEPTVKEKAPSTREIPSRIKLDDGDISFLATGNDYDGYLQQVRNGTLPLGLTTGCPSLDAHWLFKSGEFVMVVGHDNVGKSVFGWWLLMIAALYHGWKGIIFSSENTLGGFMRKMIQFYCGKPMRGYNAMSEQEFVTAKHFVEDHFKLIKAEEDMYNYKDILNMTKKAKMKYPDLNFGLIDPYNGLKTDLSGFSKLSTHDFHYEALSELKLYGQHNNFGWFINHHAVTEALRKLDKDGYPIAPNKADTEGGGKVANKAGDFMTVHRKTQHKDEWHITDIHVRKIKDTETGGMHTYLDQPVRFEMHKNQCGFTEYLELGGNPIDPIARWHQTKSAKSEEEKHWADRKDYQTLEQFKEAEYKGNWKTEVIATIPANEIRGHKDYVPDDEEKAELERLLKQGKPF